MVLCVQKSVCFHENRQDCHIGRCLPQVWGFWEGLALNRKPKQIKTMQLWFTMRQSNR